MRKWLLAVDIDGTLTDETHQIPQEVIDYLKKAHQEGAVIGFMTGRFFPFAHVHLEKMPFPYYLATQNGAQLFEMPSGTCLARYYLSKDLVMAIDYLAKEEAEDFIVYTDQSCHYQTFYREGKFSKALLEHILQLQSSAFHPFVKLECFSDLPVKAVPCLKNLGTYAQLKRLHDKISQLPVEQSLIQDPTSSTYCMNLVTHQMASKGGAIGSLLKVLDTDMPVISAGNDRNDISLLKKATLGICVGSKAPDELKAVAKLQAAASGIPLLATIDQAKVLLGL